MRELAIKRELNDDTRKQGIWLPVGENIEVFSLHITAGGEVIITDNVDYSKIYSVQSFDYWTALEKAAV